jgi:signal transduction histidine kinase
VGEVTTTKTFGVILADDVPDLRLLVRMALESSGRFKVVAEAEDGIQAVELSGLHKPDLVILDVSMPRQDGLQSLPKILAASPDTKVIVLSGFEAERLASAARELGAISYLEKGLPPAQLVAAAEEAVGISDGIHGSHVVTLEDQGLPGRPSPSDLLTFVTQELRNPLAVIYGFGMTLQERWETTPEDQKRDLLKRMTAHAAHLDSMLTNVVHMRSGHLLDTDVRWSAHSPEVLLSEIIDELAPLAKDHPVRLVMERDLPPVRVDAHRLRQVITNLLVNSTKHAPPGTAIEILGRSDSQGVHIEIRDEGPGIPPEAHQAVFEKFWRLEPSGAGLGLGLYICRQLMRAMDGDIWVGETRQGTSLLLRLPFSDGPR